MAKIWRDSRVLSWNKKQDAALVCKDTKRPGKFSESDEEDGWTDLAV